MGAETGDKSDEKGFSDSLGEPNLQKRAKLANHVLSAYGGSDHR